MANVTAFQIPGLKIWFWSNDHEPPHFHVLRRGQWEVKVSFMADASEMIASVWGTPDKKALKEIINLTVRHRPELLEQWQQIHESE